MPYTPDAIANYFIQKGDPCRDGLTPMKIQKLVYFAHGWHLALKDAPLLDEKIQAWEYGPVVERLYHALKEYEDNPVTKPITCLKTRPGFNALDAIEEYEPSLNDQPQNKVFTQALLDKMWELYGSFGAIQLSKMTHEAGTPWDQIRQKFPAYLPKGVPIPNELIKAHFQSKLLLRAAS